ncbi:unnamed protein product [Urochloa humidicola]
MPAGGRKAFRGRVYAAGPRCDLHTHTHPLPGNASLPAGTKASRHLTHPERVALTPSVLLSLFTRPRRNRFAAAISSPPPPKVPALRTSPASQPHPIQRRRESQPAASAAAAQMFLTSKYSSLLPPHHHHSDAAPPKSSSRRQQQQQQAGKAACFDAALAARLRGLLPLPGPACSPSSPLAALARLADLLALTLAEAARSLAGEGNAAAHLDAGVALLDACNAITARLERLRRRRLLARFALHLVASPAGRGRARAALVDRDDRTSSASPPPPLPSLPFDQPHGRLSAAARVLVAVNAVSSLAAAAAAAVLGGDALGTAFPRVSGNDFPWAEPFNAVSSQLSTLAICNASEVDAIDEAVQRLASLLDGKGGADEAALGAAAQEVERRTEELTARLDRLSDAVNGVFRAALGLRNAELGAFMAGPAGKTRV